MDKLKIKVGWKNNLDKLLFIIASLYLIFIAGLWLKNQQKTANPSPAPTVKENPLRETSNLTQTQTSNNHNQNIDNDPNIKQNIVTNQENIDSQQLPTINPSPTPVEIPPLPNNQTTISNIPLPPPTPNLQPLPIPQPPQPILNTSTTKTQNPKPIPLPPPPPISSKPKANSAPPLISKVNKVPVINSLSKNNPTSISQEVATDSKSTNINSANIVETTGRNYTLVGLVQLPDSKSIALFKTNNLTERVTVGSEIGTTGWVLMAVNDKQAVVSKQNQSLYLRVGENF